MQIYSAMPTSEFLLLMRSQFEARKDERAIDKIDQLLGEEPNQIAELKDQIEELEEENRQLNAQLSDLNDEVHALEQRL